MSPVRYLALVVCSVLTLAALVGGCDPTPVMLKTVAATSVGVATGYKVVRTQDHATLSAITEKAKAGDKAGAQADLDAYKPKYDATEKALDSMTATLQTAYDAIPAIQMAKDKAAVMEWVAKLMQLFADAVATAQAMGAQIPKVVQ